MKVLFITKKRSSSGGNYNYQTSYTGLYNSGVFTLEVLKEYGIDGKVVIVNDNNDIDREVYNYKPTHVIIEALWVVPEKFPILMKLHPKVKWIVRIHSKTPFLSNEGVAIEWIKGYEEIAKHNRKLVVSFNNDKTNKDFNDIHIPAVYLPNLYDIATKNASNFPPFIEEGRNVVNIGCFGAVRPMKNHLNQAIAAIKWANKRGYRVNFHINIGRVEQKGDSQLRNLRSLFAGTKHKLVEWGWLNHPDFLALVRQMDVGLQVSLSESFNVVAADFVSQRVPIVVSTDISWMPPLLKVDPNDVDAIVNRMDLAYFHRRLMSYLQAEYLQAYNRAGVKEWKKFL